MYLIEKTMRTTLIISILLLATQLVAASDFKEKIKQNPSLAAHTYLAYPNKNNIKYTAPPEGYIPFHIEHYGRHGSRWLTSEKQYLQPIETLHKANKYGYLTEQGKDALRRLEIIQLAAHKREGELSELGAEQHRGIARRMYHNFPEVFADSATINARSTVVIRCILSMENECQELKALNPKLRISHDASNADMYYMNFYDDFYKVQHDSARAYFKRLTANDINHISFINRLISNKQFAKDSVDAPSTMEHIFDIASNMQSHNFDFDLYDLFTLNELYALWNRWNKFWYIGYGNSAEYGHIHPYIQRNLLYNIIESADNAIKSNKNSANLRFGHEVCVLPLAVLMELGDCNKRVSSLDNLANEWRAHDIFPMACNIQMIFYRNKDNQILVKVLLNEEEVQLPIKSNIHPYYDWSNLRSYYLGKLQ